MSKIFEVIKIMYYFVFKENNGFKVFRDLLWKRNSKDVYFAYAVYMRTESNYLITYKSRVHSSSQIISLD